MTSGAAESSAPRYRVLLVDDEPWMLRVMDAVLSLDMDVVTCASGEEALRLLALGSFDVLCSDLRMPRMSGAELLEKVGLLHADVGCLLLTASTGRLLPEHLKNHEMLLKPFDPQRLLDIVNRLARAARGKKRSGGRQ